MDMAPEKEKSSDFVEALAKGMAILESFDAAHPEMTLSEVARRVGLSPAAARRSLITLTALGYIGQTQKRFHLKPKIMSLGSALYFSARIDELMQPELREIVDKFGDASSVATMEGDMVIYIAHVSVQRARRAAAVVGARYPAYATSLGRVMLAGLSENRLNDYFESVEPVALTSKTMIDKEALRAEIRLVRDQGFSTTVDQLDYGITAISVPIRDIAGNTVAALNSSGYTGMVTPESLSAQRLQELHAAASRIALSIARYPILGSIIGT